MIPVFDFFNSVATGASEPSRSDYQAESSGIFVVSIGGSLIVDEQGPRVEAIRAFADAISSLHSSGKKIVVVVGGGKTARNYANAAASLGANNFEQDLLGIHVTRANAMLLANAIAESYNEVVSDVSRVSELLEAGKVPVFGGLMPFFTTDSVGALLAEKLNATFVNLTNVDGIYDSDPKTNPDARRFDEIGYNKLVSLIVAAGSRPGQNVVLDIACCMILRRSRIPAAVLDGDNIENFKAFVNGYSFTGTMIKETNGEDEAIAPVAAAEFGAPENSAPASPEHSVEEADIEGVAKDKKPINRGKKRKVRTYVGNLDKKSIHPDEIDF
ncbi:MAG: UMP kinase [archaeon]|mgnify:CR=1 FL=1